MTPNPLKLFEPLLDILKDIVMIMTNTTTRNAIPPPKVISQSMEEMREVAR